MIMAAFGVFVLHLVLFFPLFINQGPRGSGFGLNGGVSAEMKAAIQDGSSL
jgi:hypothetical protein